MAALTGSRNTPRYGTETVPGYLPAVPMAASAKLQAGGIACADANGRATPGATATGLTVLGVSEETVDNSAGAAGAISANKIRRGVYPMANLGTDLVVQADLLKTVYLVDDQTVAHSDGTGTRSAAGKFVGFDPVSGLPLVELGA